jgi:hypothetical protein
LKKTLKLEDNAFHSGSVAALNGLQFGEPPNHHHSTNACPTSRQMGGTFQDAVTRSDPRRRVNAVGVIEIVADAFLLEGICTFVRSYNGPEMVAKVLRQWLSGRGTRSLYIEPGSVFLQSWDFLLRSLSQDTSVLLLDQVELTEIITSCELPTRASPPRVNCCAFAPS